jgi:phosphoribosylaminoimidazole-succinocarboxamide synthase
MHRLHRGKVRDIFAIDRNHMLLVATDRVSAFDVVLPQRLEGKGKILTSLSKFWFDLTSELVQNHVLECDVEKMPEQVQKHADLLAGRSMLVQKAVPLKAEFIVRGYLAGSGWKEYQKTGAVCGHELPPGLQESSRLPEPILTPSTKAPQGEHDENITIPQLAHIIGAPLASQAGALSLALYEQAASHAKERGILLADTKFEFGLVQDQLTLIDEVFTPDSSRYWLEAEYEPGRAQDSYDKQVIRDHLLSMGWNKQPPAPELPTEIMEKARQRYIDIERRLRE